jgi:hypothetical protein
MSRSATPGDAVSKITTFDHYIPLVPEASAKAKVLLQLEQDHVIFYVTAATKELRVRAYGSTQTYTLMQGVEHCHGFVEDGIAYLYLAMTSGSIQLMTYRYFGEQARSVMGIILGYTASYLHVVAQSGGYLMVVDTGGKFNLFSATDPTFTAGFHTQQLYSNLRDPIYTVAKPVIGIHPQDLHVAPNPSRVTIAFERTSRASGAKVIGFLATEVVM